MRKLLLALLVAVSVACAGPTTVVRTVDTRPALAFRNAPDGTVVYVDGMAVGAPRHFDGRPNILRVEPGTHEIQIREGERVIFSQRVFVESELKTIEVH